MKKYGKILSVLVLCAILLFSNTITANAKHKYLGSKNNVYGKLTHKTKKTAGGLRRDKSMTYVYYGTGTHKTINIVKENFKNLPLNDKLDSEVINEHISDFMEKDATKVGTDADGKIIYSSSKINKKYLVEFTRNNNGDITRITIFRGDLNDVN